VRGLCRRRCREDRLPNSFDIFQHFIVPETEDTVSVLYEPAIALAVAVIFGMLSAIDFDHEPFLSTDKIGDIRPDRLLPNEFEPAQRSGTKIPPKLLFRAG
jgi:hypothetical protein